MPSDAQPLPPTICEILAETPETQRPTPIPVVDEAAAAAREAELQAITQQMIRAQRVSDNLDRWAAACPPDLQDSDWSHPALTPHRPQIDQILNYTLSPLGIIASGPSGRGKSRAMWALMRRFAADGLEVRYYHAHDWFASLQEQVHYGRDDARGWVETIACRQIVYLDDLGQQALSSARAEWAQAWFFRFLDIRLGRKLPLFISTNLQARQIAGNPGSLRSDPLLRRLLELATPITFHAP